MAQSLGLRVQNVEFRAQRSELKVQGSEFRVQGIGVKIKAQCPELRVRVQSAPRPRRCPRPTALRQGALPATHAPS
jgi:hypothetical protein